MDRVNRSMTSLRSRMTAPDVMESISFLSKRVEDLEIVLNTKNKEIRRIEMINKQLVTGMQKRDEIIASALEENRKLKESLRWYQRLLSQAKKPKEEAPPPKPQTANTLAVPGRSPKKRDSWQPENTAKTRLFDDLMEGDDSFADRFIALDPQAQREFLQKIRTQNQDYKNLVDVTLRLKKLINSTHNVSVSMVVSEMLDRLVEEVCDNLRCDRASVFVLDELNNELWTKTAKGMDARNVRIPADKGIAGYVANSGKPVNIEDAYKDPRFSKKVDIHMNYRTKTILAIPMRDVSGKIIGVCEAINKLEGAFTPDDEGLFEMLAANAGAVLKNSIQNETIVQMQNRLHTLLNGVMDIVQAETLSSVLEIATARVQMLVSSPQAMIYLYKEEALVIMEADGYEEAFLPMGLAGHCATTGAMLNIENAYQHPLFNNQVDIETSMPVIIFPLKNRAEKIVGVLELVNPRGIYGRSETQKAKIDPLDNELLSYFSKVLAVAMERLTAN